MEKQHESTVISYSSRQSLEARSDLFNSLQTYPGTPEETERSLGLFVRGSLLARLFAIRELYEMVVAYPGMILDIGTWRGQTAVVCENLRAIFEPLHMNRRIAAFDTFEGYKGFSEKDKHTALHKEGTYGVGEDYAKYLENLLVLHERNNALGHNTGKHRVIKGDCRKTLPGFFNEHPNEFVALAFFDVNSFDPTFDAFKVVYERLIPGGVIAMWQLTRDVIPAEGKVYTQEILNKFGHTLHRSKFYPGLCYMVKN